LPKMGQKPATVGAYSDLGNGTTSPLRSPLRQLAVEGLDRDRDGAGHSVPEFRRPSA